MRNNTEFSNCLYIPACLTMSRSFSKLKETKAGSGSFLPMLIPHLEEGGMRKLEHEKGFWFSRTDTQALIFYLLSF